MALARWRGDKASRPPYAQAVSDAVRAGEDAQDRAALLERLLDATDQGVVQTDQSGEVLFVNRAAREILGFGPRRGSPGVESIRLQDLVERTLESDHDIIEDRQLYIPNRRQLSVHALPFEDGALVLISDVTKARRADQVRQDFVANVSHELKTPVTGIALMAEQLPHAIREDQDAALLFAERIHTEADRLARLVVDLLDLSRIESDRALELTIIDARALAYDAVERNATLANAKHIAVAIEGGNGIVFDADATQAAAALGNLVDNAVRYSPENGAVRVQIEANDEEISFSVSDDGPGIPTNELDRIFERFYRVDKARARATGGTGLGLSIVRHVAERHGGRVAAESELGRGSLFRLIFPRNAHPAEAEPS